MSAPPIRLMSSCQGWKLSTLAKHEKSGNLPPCEALPTLGERLPFPRETANGTPRETNTSLKFNRVTSHNCQTTRHSGTHRRERDMDQVQLFREQATLARSVANWKMATDRIAMFELSNTWMIPAKQIERQNRAQLTKRRASNVIQRRRTFRFDGLRSSGVISEISILGISLSTSFEYSTQLRGGGVVGHAKPPFEVAIAVAEDRGAISWPSARLPTYVLGDSEVVLGGKKKPRRYVAGITPGRSEARRNNAREFPRYLINCKCSGGVLRCYR